MKKKINVFLIAAGGLMIAVSLLNYLMNDDHVSLGIFFFLGAGFIMLGFKDRFDEKKSKRWSKYAGTLFFAAVVIFLYWIGSAKLDLF
jgi:hypothetical protein